MTNLGYQTDFFFLEEAREIKKFSGFTLVKSPNQPSFFYGNFLLLDQAPINTDREKLEEIFKEKFTDKRINHLTFCWSGNKIDGVQSFLDAGYNLEESTVLTGVKEDLIDPLKKNKEVSLRAFNSKKDWQARFDLEWAEKPAAFSDKGYKDFLNGRSEVYQRLHSQGNGNFYGAFIGNELVASAGLFHQGGLGRFQSVLTKSKYRKRGICKTLIHFICQEGFERLDKLVIVADKGYHALDIYKRIGFKESFAETSVYWHKKKES